jgi:Na+:H+ antiporter
MHKAFWTALGVALTPALAAASDATHAPGLEMAHRMMLLVIQLGLVLFAAKLGNLLFERLHLPGALGELIAGMIIGPFALGHIAFYGFSHGLFPMVDGLAISPELGGVSAIAAVVLLFVVGLETDLGLLMRYSVAGFVVGMGGVVASFFLGAGAVMVFSETLFGESLSLFAPPCLLLGTVTTATSVGITARILSERRKLDSPEGVTILSAAVIDDVIGIVLLAVVMGVVTASKAAGRVDWGHIGIIAGKAVGVWLTATVIGLVASRKISVLLKWFGRRTAIAVMALALAMILAGLFEEAGLAMIIGAYVMGLSLSRADISHVVREKLEPVYELLIPVFFCVMGMRIDLGALASPGVVVFGLVYAGVALGSKVIGAGVPAMLLNFNLRGALRIGFGMAPRCEVALIIGGIGLASGILTPELFAAVVIMILVNTVVAPPALVALYRSDASGTRREIAPSEKARASESFDFPSLPMAEFLVAQLSSIFESEGFFAHVLSRQRKLYQLRKDTTIIDMRCEGTKLTFDCHPSQVPLVNIAMYEAVAALEQTVRGLREPLDSQSFGTRVQDEGLLGPQTLSLAGYLTPRLVSSDLTGSTKGEVIDELLDLLDRSGLVKDRDAAQEAVRQREESMSTGLQFGVAIPHGKTDAVDRLVCAVGLHRAGVDFDAMDGEPSHIFVLTLSPLSKPAPHVQFMSTISQALNAEGRQRLLACANADEMYRALTSAAPPAAPVPARPTKFRLADYVSAETLCADLSARTKEDAIDELLGLLHQHGRLADLEVTRQAVLERERQMSTGMEEGVAIPHGRTDAVTQLVCAVGVSREGLEFGSADGKPTHIIVLALTPTAGTDPYLQFAAAIVNALDAEGRRKVLRAQSPEQLREALLTGATG